ncbi:hypothetical protein GCM10010912_22190 [Paenibacillus albidus]|uniref:Uncharacterized protein n=1 Tax=Paenibacillus albidus TaxID=2041023 RepID=A0A917CAI5_9BACL|nr:hypothetical protein GCM10010912_22190 [Paenibacillus albidus]
MSKPITHRISIFTSKLNLYSRQRYDYLLRRSDKEAPSNRFDRLMVYKNLMHQQFEQ